MDKRNEIDDKCHLVNYYQYPKLLSYALYAPPIYKINYSSFFVRIFLRVLLLFWKSTIKEKNDGNLACNNNSLRKKRKARSHWWRWASNAWQYGNEKFSEKNPKDVDGKIIAGFAGSAADGIALFERLEAKLRAFSGQLQRAAVELAKEWRTDRALRKLEALLLVADQEKTLILSGTGDIIEPDGGAASIGSGSGYALAAAKALLDNSNLSSLEIAHKSLSIAADLCIYTNAQFSFEELQ